jgi:hypothetical protein
MSKQDNIKQKAHKHGGLGIKVAACAVGGGYEVVSNLVSCGHRHRTEAGAAKCLPAVTKSYKEIRWPKRVVAKVKVKVKVSKGKAKVK